MTFKKYQRKQKLSELRPHVPGEDLAGISVSDEDTPGEGGMIARNPENHTDKWYIAKQYFIDNFDPDPVEQNEK